MAENLAYLPKVSPPTQVSLNEPLYYVYGYYGSNVAEAKANGKYDCYGVLYNWLAANDACPTGWHLPTNEEWEQLAAYVSESEGPFEGTSTCWIGVGKYLKTTVLNWIWCDGSYLDWGGTDTYGFAGWMGGVLAVNMSNFGAMDELGRWWSASISELWAKNWSITKRSMDFCSGGGSRIDYGFSVRCVKD